jgi:hypothetical protein
MGMPVVNVRKMCVLVIFGLRTLFGMGFTLATDFYLQLVCIGCKPPPAYELQTNRTRYSTVFNSRAAQMIEFEPRI